MEYPDFLIRELVPWKFYHERKLVYNRIQGGTMICISKSHAFQESSRFKKKDLGNLPNVYEYLRQESKGDGNRLFSVIPVKK